MSQRDGSKARCTATYIHVKRYTHCLKYTHTVHTHMHRVAGSGMTLWPFYSLINSHTCINTYKHTTTVHQCPFFSVFIYGVCVFLCVCVCVWIYCGCGVCGCGWVVYTLVLCVPKIYVLLKTNTKADPCIYSGEDKQNPARTFDPPTPLFPHWCLFSLTHLSTCHFQSVTCYFPHHGLTLRSVSKP